MLNLGLFWSRNFQTNLLEKEIAGLEAERARREELFAALQSLLVALLQAKYSTTASAIPHEAKAVDEKETLGGFYDEAFIRGTYRSDPPGK